MIHPSVEKLLKGYRRGLTMREMTNPKDPSEHYAVCQIVKATRLVDEGLGLYVSQDLHWPLFFVRQASQVDGRWIPHLEACRFASQQNPLEAYWDKRRRMEKQMMDDTEAWARDEGWWHFKRSIDEYNLANVDRVDPSYGTKALEDKLGRELR